MEFLKIAKIISNIHKVQESYQEMKEDAEKAKVDKYCVYCGAKFKTGISLFCPQCGAADPIQKEETVKKRQTDCPESTGLYPVFCDYNFWLFVLFPVPGSTGSPSGLANQLPGLHTGRSV